MPSLGRKGKSRPKPVMNVTPLVDVVLVLLIIFMVVIPALEEGLPIDLPAVVNADDEEESSVDPFMLSLTRHGNLYFDHYRLADEELEQRLREANAREPQRRLVVRGDREVRYARVRDLMAIVQSVGFPGVSLRVNELDGRAAAEGAQ